MKTNHKNIVSRRTAVMGLLLCALVTTILAGCACDKPAQTQSSTTTTTGYDKNDAKSMEK